MDKIWTKYIWFDQVIDYDKACILRFWRFWVRFQAFGPTIFMCRAIGPDYLAHPNVKFVCWQLAVEAGVHTRSP
jgi:hypothetical protein